MSIPTQFVQAQNFTLSGAGSTVGDTTLILSSFQDIDGVNLIMADFGTLGFLTIDPNNGSSEEQVSFTGVTQNVNGTATITGVDHVLFKAPYTGTSGITKDHLGGAIVVISNTAGFYQSIINYIDDIAISGAPNASTTVKGILQAATTAQVNAGTATGSTGAPLSVTPDVLLASNYGLTLPPSGIISMYGGISAPTGWVLCDGSSLLRAGTYANLFTAIGTAYGSADGTHFNVPDLRSRVAVGVGTGTKVFTFSSRSTNIITVTGTTNSSTNEVQTGQAVVFSSNGGSITGLTNATTYYLIRIAYNQFAVASSLANAQNGTAISLSGDSGTPFFTATLTTRSAGDTGGEETHAMNATELLAHIHQVAPNTSIVSGGSGNSVPTSSGSGGGVFNSSSTGGNAAMNNMSPFTAVTYIIKI